MKSTHTRHFRVGRALVRLFPLILVLASPVFFYAQSDVAALKAKADELMQQDKMTEALPVLEKLIAADPKSKSSIYEGKRVG